MGRDNVTGAVNQQERLDAVVQLASGILRDHMPNTSLRWSDVKRWSDLHGDMQSQAEMTWPAGRGVPRQR